MKSIFLYRDEGICPSSLRATVRSLREETDHPIELVDRYCFLENNWEERAAMIVFPGGRDVPYAKALQGGANRRIRDYVVNGGRYLGICAGAYYGSSSISFEPGGKLEVIGTRELGFFPGCATGPALGLGQFVYGTSQGARIASLSLAGNYFQSTSAKAYYNGGCTFTHASSYPNVTILGYYDQLKKQPAIILCQVGQGKALLSGIHPEYHRNDLNRISEKDLYDQLSEADLQRKNLFSRLIEIVQEQNSCHLLTAP